MSSQKQPIVLADIAHVIDTVAQRPAEEGYLAIDQLVQKVFGGHKLLTLLIFRPATVEVERLYSSNTEAYPVGGRKQKKGTPWSEKVLYGGQFHICRDMDDIIETFPDHALIASLGATGMINIPVLHGGTCVGTININRDAGDFTEADFPVSRILAGLALPLFMAKA